MKTYKSFDFNFCKTIGANFVGETKDYWLTDGYVALNTAYFTPSIPTELKGLVAAKTVFIKSGKKAAIETENPLPIEKIIPQGPRYILKDSRLTHADGCRILYGTDRTVCVQSGIFDTLKTCIRDDLSFLQNYDKPLGAINVYHSGQDIYDERPIAVIMPMREGDETFREILSNVQELNDVLNKMKKQAAA